MFSTNKKFNTIICSASIVLLMATSALAQESEGGEKKTYVVNSIPNLTRGYEQRISGHDIFDLSTWKDMDLERHHLEMLIFNVAPILGGCNCEIVMHDYEVDTPHARSIEEVRAGDVISHPIASFTDDSRVQEGISLSEPILDPEDFFVGLYTNDMRKDILETTDFNDIQKMRFVAQRSWEIDNKVIEANNLPRVEADNWNAVIFMLAEGKADVIMQPFFATPDMSFTEEDGRLKYLPIPGVKMAFPQGRHYIISENHPDGPEFLAAMNRGIEILKQDDFLKKAHEWAGVINPQTADYAIFGKGTID